MTKFSPSSAIVRVSCWMRIRDSVSGTRLTKTRIFMGLSLPGPSIRPLRSARRGVSGPLERLQDERAVGPAEAERIAEGVDEPGLPGGVRDVIQVALCLLYTSPSPRDGLLSRMPS